MFQTTNQVNMPYTVHLIYQMVPIVFGTNPIQPTFLWGKLPKNSPFLGTCSGAPNPWIGFVGKIWTRKPSIFPWRSWGFPVNFPLIQSIELKTNHQKAMTSWSSEHDSIGEWGKTHQKTYDFPTTIPFFVGEIHPFTSFFQHFWWPPGLNGELMEWHSKKSMWTVEHALLGMKELVAHPV